MRAPILPLIALALATLECRRGPETVAPDSPLASEQKLLERQVASLREAIADAKSGTLFAPKDIAVGVSEQVVQSTLEQALPIEQPVANDFRARIDRAQVSFRSMQGSVRLEGRIWALSNPETFADLTLIGGINTAEVEPGTGVLRAEIVLDGWDVKRASAVGAEGDWVRTLVLLLGENALTSLRDLVPLLRIPVGIEDGLDLPGASGGPLTIPAGRVPFEAEVSRVIPLSGRLWAMVHVTTTGWQPTTTAKGQVRSVPRAPATVLKPPSSPVPSAAARKSAK
ncbi:MAG: hypothetical protein ABI672_16045 [Vicinamibacteria bacterium]